MSVLDDYILKNKIQQFNVFIFQNSQKTLSVSNLRK